MSKQLLSVGIDVGTTTTQVIFSRLTAQNRASAYSVPEMVIENREVICKGDVHFTPLLDNRQVDGEKLRCLVAEEYEKAGVCRENVDTGAIIITGETSRKENAAKVSRVLASFAGDFVVATAGPHLESVLAAKGAGAVEYSRKMGKKVLHMDIGGGTSNLCLIEDGKTLATGCLNVGGRLLKLDENGRITYRSAVLEDITNLRVGDVPTAAQLEELAALLAAALEMAAGLREPTDILCKLTTKETGTAWSIPHAIIPSFSGGVADCIATDHPPVAFGDLGPVLGKAIRNSRLCAGEYLLGRETIRATVIGAGCHSTQLSGSTVFYQNIAFPMKNIPVAVLEDPKSAEAVQQALSHTDAEQAILAIPGVAAPDYDYVRKLAKVLAEGFEDRPVLVCVEADMAKALGHCLRLLLPASQPCLCIDGLSLDMGSYLDVGEPVGPAFPVVIKTLVLGDNP